MKLISFSIKNYRSITATEKINLTDLNILLGPNNEGKSNILTALALGLSLLSRRRRGRGLFFRHLPNHKRETEERYNWERDFPINLQKNSKRQKTVFTFDFELTNKELKKLSKITAVKLSNPLSFAVEISSSGEADISIK